MNTTETPIPEPTYSPHCRMPWPFRHIENIDIARLAQAAYGAATIARLLSADAALASDIRESGSPSEEPQPFNEGTVAGLFAALHTCLYDIEASAEHMERYDFVLKKEWRV